MENWREECGVMMNLFYSALCWPSHIDRVLLRGLVADFIRKCKHLPGVFVFKPLCEENMYMYIIYTLVFVIFV